MSGRSYSEYSKERMSRVKNVNPYVKESLTASVTAARALLDARMQASMTQAQVAEASGINQSEISKIEAGRVVPRWDTMTKLLAATGHHLHVSR